MRLLSKIFGGGGGGGKAKLPKVDLGSDIQSYVSGFQAQLPTILGSERQYRPEFQGLNLGDISAFLGGVGGQQGLFGLGSLATEESQRQLQAARQAEILGITGQAGIGRGLLETLSPESAAQVQAATRAAEQAYRRADQRQLSPQEQRDVTQQTREAFGQRGMLGSTGSVASEILNRDVYRRGVQQEAREEAAQAGGRAFQLGQAFYTSPLLEILGGLPTSYTAGQQQVGLGLGAIGAGTPQLYDIGTALNIGAANRANQVAAQSANAQARASKKAGKMSAVGSIVGAGLGAIFSDERTKEDIKKVGKTDSGLPIYTFKYKGGNATQMGVMAQDVEKKKPKAVREIGGLKAVNYAMID